MPHILVADDEPRYVRLIKFNLEILGYQVSTATEGETVVYLAQTQPLDLILLDVRMPRMNGFEACQRIRQFSNIPIIFITASAEDANKAIGLQLGANAYLTKPFTSQELLDCVLTWLGPQTTF